MYAPDFIHKNNIKQFSFYFYLIIIIIITLLTNAKNKKIVHLTFC